MVTSRSPISMVSEPVWGEKTHSLNRQQAVEMVKQAGPMTTYAEANIEFYGRQTRSHRLTDGPTVLLPQRPPSGDGLGEHTSGIKGKFKRL